MNFEERLRAAEMEIERLSKIAQHMFETLKHLRDLEDFKTSERSCTATQSRLSRIWSSR